MAKPKDVDVKINVQSQIDGRSVAHLITKDGKIISRDIIELSRQVMTPNEVRKMLGLSPLRQRSANRL